MFPKLRSWFLLSTVIALAGPNVCQAYVQYVKLPLSGHRGYVGGAGSVLFSQSFGDSGRHDGGTIVIEVSNVPLPAGTELEVVVDDKEVGTLKLDRRRGGRLILESGANRAVPRLHPGSLVTIRIPAGPTVLW